jgi:hypothetical protein
MARALHNLAIREISPCLSQADMRGLAGSSFRQQAPAGFDKDLRTGDDVGVACVFTPVMTDAADGGYEQHARRHDRGENLGIMAGAAWHADRFAAGKGDARSFDCTLECRIHHGGGAGPILRDKTGLSTCRQRRHVLGVAAALARLAEVDRIARHGQSDDGAGDQEEAGNAEGPIVAAGRFDHIAGDDRRRGAGEIAADDEDAHGLADILRALQLVVEQSEVERYGGAHAGERQCDEREQDSDIIDPGREQDDRRAEQAADNDQASAAGRHPAAQQ